MDSEKIIGFTANGVYCVWCNYFYPSSHFKQSNDVCQECEDFRYKHYYSQGNFFIRDVNGVKFRVFLSTESKISDYEINTKLKELI